MRLCQPGSYNATLNCEHVFDRIGTAIAIALSFALGTNFHVTGCQYNMPHTVEPEGSFEVCYADVGLPAGRYYESGVLQTYTQPPEANGPITSIPYEPSTPASSNCSSLTSTPAAFLDPANPPASGSANLPASGSVSALESVIESSAPARRALRWERNGVQHNGL